MNKILSYSDTREYDFELQSFIPGTGEKRNCDLCGSKHEIHLDVYIAKENKIITVGSSCAKKLVNFSEIKKSEKSFTSLKNKQFLQKIKEEKIKILKEKAVITETIEEQVLVSGKIQKNIPKKTISYAEKSYSIYGGQNKIFSDEYLYGIAVGIII